MRENNGKAAAESSYPPSATLHFETLISHCYNTLSTFFIHVAEVKDPTARKNFYNVALLFQLISEHTYTMWPTSNRQQSSARDLSSQHQQQYGNQSSGWLSDLPLQLIDRLNDLNDNGQQRDYFDADQLQDFNSSRGSYDGTDMHYQNQQNCHDSQYNGYENNFFTQRGKDFIPIDRRSRSSNRSCCPPYTPTSVIDQASSFSMTPSPNNGEYSRENSPPPPSALAPCRQLPCRYLSIKRNPLKPFLTPLRLSRYNLSDHFPALNQNNSF